MLPLGLRKRFKASKTLSGIETRYQASYLYQLAEASKPLKPFQGLKQFSRDFNGSFGMASKPLKPFQGLKPASSPFSNCSLCFKASKTLSGIETHQLQSTKTIILASKPLKPFQGLKQYLRLLLISPFLASKPLKPFQGLKLSRDVKHPPS